ncbi:MAG: aminopeptidase N, partial [Acetobacteraceae bacterium]|nr:aminopeptidase N [Acetobacteraceae bacterium]
MIYTEVLMPDANTPPAAGQAATHETRLADYRPPAFLVDTVDLAFDLSPTETIVRSALRLRRNPHPNAPRGPLHLDGAGQPVEGLAIDGAAAGPNRYQLAEHSLTISDLPDTCTLEIETRIAPQDNTELSGLYVSNGSFFTQCEAEGFRRITYFPDRPDVMARFSTTITADKSACPVMLSNGNPGEIQDVGNNRHRITWTDPHPKPCYLFALVAGGLVAVRDTFTTRSGRKVALAIYVRPGDEDRCDHAMRSLIKAMRWDEERFGLEYDLDVFNIAAVSDFNMGAMENKGLNIFNTRYVLAKPETATDSDYQGIETVIAHEYFHNWTGDRVTCRDWFQLSLKEGLTVYRDQEFTMDQGSRAVKRISDVRALRSAQFREDAGPLAHPVQPQAYQAIDNFYTATVYNKGAEVIRMMATIIGREAFRRGMDLYFQRHDNQAATIDDFVAAMADASGPDLTDFKRWYHQAGTPEIAVSDSYDPTTRCYTLALSQRTPPTCGQPEKQPLVIPVATGLITDDDDGTATHTLMLTESQQTFIFDNLPSRPVPSLLREFSAPVKLKGIPEEHLRILAARDSDPFVRWDSAQQYATQRLLDMVAALARGEKTPTDTGLIDAVRTTLARADEDHAFAAEALILPAESILADHMEIADVDNIHTVRDAARAAIADALRPELRDSYQRLTDTGPYTIDGPAIGRRALRNACLHYLAANSNPEGIQLAKAQFDAGQNMTDVLIALAVLSAVDCPERTQALSAFYSKWRSDPLVLDKWFSIQATSPLSDTIATVQNLARHPDFQPRNPNRVRALVGSFTSNQVRFHDISGVGYRFLSEAIIQIDPSNPQVAARLVA